MPPRPDNAARTHRPRGPSGAARGCEASFHPENRRVFRIILAHYWLRVDGKRDGCYMVNQNLRPCLGQPGRAEQSAPVTETEQAPGKNEPGNDQPSPRRTAGSNRGVPPSAVRDERGAG